MQTYSLFQTEEGIWRVLIAALSSSSSVPAADKMVDLGGYVIILVETREKKVKLYGELVQYCQEYFLIILHNVIFKVAFSRLLVNADCFPTNIFVLRSFQFECETDTFFSLFVKAICTNAHTFCTNLDEKQIQSGYKTQKLIPFWSLKIWYETGTNECNFFSSPTLVSVASAFLL